MGEDEQATVTEVTPTVTEREVIKRRTVEEDGGERPKRTRRLGGNIQEATATVAREGYDVFNPDTYDPSYPLRVLIGIRQGSATGYAQRAFFFYGDDYLGNDTSGDSAGIEYAGQDDNTVSLTYKLYQHNDPNCCPTGGEATVRTTGTARNSCRSTRSQRTTGTRTEAGAEGQRDRSLENCGAIECWPALAAIAAIVLGGCDVSVGRRRDDDGQRARQTVTERDRQRGASQARTCTTSRPARTGCSAPRESAP